MVEEGIRARIPDRKAGKKVDRKADVSKELLRPENSLTPTIALETHQVQTQGRFIHRHPPDDPRHELRNKLYACHEDQIQVEGADFAWLSAAVKKVDSLH